jgi:hypothetical protein
LAVAPFWRAFAVSFAPALLATALGGGERCLGGIRDKAGLELSRESYLLHDVLAMRSCSLSAELKPYGTRAACDRITRRLPPHAARRHHRLVRRRSLPDYPPRCAKDGSLDRVGQGKGPTPICARPKAASEMEEQASN